jgi:membrane protein required for colicin V production
MLDLVVGIAVLAFILLGMREGLIKALGGVAAVFAALFLATGALGHLSQQSPKLSDPNNLGASVIFLLVWTLSYILLEFLLSILFKKIVRIVVLGQLDRVGGMVVGGFKGLLVCGLIFDLALFSPMSPAVKKLINESKGPEISMRVYRWAYPFAKKVVPQVQNFWEDKIKSSPELAEKAKSETLNKVDQAKKSQEERIMKLLKDQKLLHGAPVRRTDDNK